MKLQFKKTILFTLLSGCLAFSACDSDPENSFGFFHLGDQQELLQLGEQVNAIEVNVDDGLKTFSVGLMSKLPYPLNAVGGGFIAAFWKEQPNKTEEMMVAMNAKLDKIQGTLASIQNQIRNLRGEIRSDFIVTLEQNEFRDIQAAANHVFRRISISYIEDRKAGMDSKKLDERIQRFEEKLSEAVDKFLFLEPAHKFSAVAEFTTLASLHIALLQEQVFLFKTENYKCLETACEAREIYLTSRINQLSNYIDDYVKHYLEVAQAIERTRLNRIGAVTTYRVWVGYGSNWSESNRIGYTFFDKALKSKYYYNKEDPSLDKPPVSEQVIKYYDNHRDSTANELDQTLTDNLYSIVDAFLTIQNELTKIEAVKIPDNCVRFYTEKDFSGISKLICGSRLESWDAQDNVWDNGVSSLRIGDHVNLSLYPGYNQGGTPVLFNTGDSINDLSHFDIDNDASSIKVEIKNARAQCVRFYTEEAYKGDYIEKCGFSKLSSIKDSDWGVNWDNAISSLLIGSNLNLNLYQNENFQGRMAGLAKNQRIGSLTAWNMKQNVSSLEITRKLVPDNCIRFYKEKNYKGENTTLCQYGAFESLSDTLGDNSWDENISSMRIGKHMGLVTFEDDDFEGKIGYYPRGESIPDLSSTQMDNKISSAKIYRQMVHPNCVRIFKNPDFRRGHYLDQVEICGTGNHKSIEERLYTQWDDTVSSFIVGNNVKLQIFPDPNFGGVSKTFTNGAYVATLQGTGIDNKTSSFKVRGKNFTPPPEVEPEPEPGPEPEPEPALGANCVRFYKDVNFGGDYKDKCGVGNYSWVKNDLGASWNDVISSLRVGANVSVRIYRHASFKGTSKNFIKGTSVPDLGPSGLNNQLSSFKIHKRLPGLIWKR